MKDMRKNLPVLAGSLALVLSLAGVARADDISFSVVSGKTGGLTANPTGFNSGNGTVVLVSDTDLNEMFLLGGTASVTAGASTSYTTSGAGAGKTLNATYADGAGIDVIVKSGSCGVTQICFEGEENGGTYSAKTTTTGSFQGQFTVVYVNPVIPEKFGDSLLFTPIGSDSLNSGINTFTLGAGGVITADKATLTGGTITYETPALPEPASLVLFGSGLLALAGAVRRRFAR
jgi:hypothetical protein